MSFIILLPCLLLPCIMSPITLYHVFHYPVPCLPLLCYHVSYYSVSCLLLLCLMSSITLSPLRNAKPQKKSWQVNYPKEPYSSKQLTCQLVYLCTPSTLKDSSTLKRVALLKPSQTFHYLFFMNAAGLAFVPKGWKSITGWSKNRGPLRYNWLPCWLYL